VGPRPAYCADCGPEDGPPRSRDMHAAIGIHATPRPEPGEVWSSIGIAYPRGWLPDSRGPVVAWRLAIGGAELPGLWVCHRRRFVPAEEWARGRAEGGQPRPGARRAPTGGGGGAGGGGGGGGGGGPPAGGAPAAPAAP